MISNNNANSMPLLLNPCNIYFALWCIYLLQGTLYETSGIFSQLVFVLILFISFYYAKKASNAIEKPLYFKGITVLLFMYTIYGCILFLVDGATTVGMGTKVPTYYYIKTYYLSLLPIFPCYYFANKKMVNIKSLSYWCIIFFAVAITEYFKQEREVLAALLENKDITNNAGYIFVSLMPCMVVFKKRLLQYVGLGACFIFVMMSMKRGAVVVGGAVILVYVMQNIRHLSLFKKGTFAVAMIIVIIGVNYYLSRNLYENDYFQARLENTIEGNSSGRDDLFMHFWTYYLEKESPIEQLVGMGANGTLKIYTNYAHNDWLETLINQGLLGVLFFTIYWICFYKTARSKRYVYKSRQILFIIFVMTLLRSFFSMSIGGNTIYICSVLGFSLANSFNEEVTDNKNILRRIAK